MPNSAFSVGVDQAPLHALGNGIDGTNGVFVYGSGGFPTSSFSSTNYWVDVVFAGPVAAKLTSATPDNAATAVATSAVPTATLDRDVTASSVSVGTVADGSRNNV